MERLRRRPRTVAGHRLTVASLVALLLLVPTLPANAEEQAEAEAREHFERGQALEAEGNLADALEAYDLALRLRPSFRLHRHIGRVCRGLGRYLEALTHFRQFLSEGGDGLTQEQREWTTAAISGLDELLARVRVVAPEGATVLVDGRAAGVTPLAEPIDLDPGTYQLELRLEGHQALRRELTLERGESHTLEVQLQPLGETPSNATTLSDLEGAPDAVIDDDAVEAASADDRPEGTPSGRRRLRPAAFWSCLGIAAAVLTGGAVFGGLTVQEHGTFDGLNDPQRSPAESLALEDARRRGEAFALTADVLFFTAAALGVATVVISLFTDFGRTRRVAP